MIHSELCSACGGPLQLGIGLVSLKNDRLLSEARALIVYMCAGQMRRPKIPESTIVFKAFSRSRKVVLDIKLTVYTTLYTYVFENFL